MRGPSSRIHAAASRYCGTAGCTVPSARYGRRLTGLGYLWPWAWRFGQGQARSDREPLPAPAWLVPARAGVVEYEAQHRVARHSSANLNDLHHCHIFCVQVQTRYPYSWPLRPEAKYRRGLPAPQHAWAGRGRSGRLGGWGVNWSRGCNRPCAPLVSGYSIAVCQDPGGQAERQDRSTEASTTQARSARTRSTQTGGSPGRGTAARRAALAPRRPGSWKASRELPRRRTAQNAPDRARLAGPGPALQDAPVARLSRSIPSAPEGAIASGCGSPVRAARAVATSGSPARTYVAMAAMDRTPRPRSSWPA